MHIPDGFLDLPTSAATGVIAASALAWSLRGHAADDDRLVPIAGMTAATVFALQLCNFPVGAGTSGHLLGGALTAALVGPRLGVLCMTVVIAVQALLFADGGLSALGANLTNMAVISVLGAALIQTIVQRLLPRRRGPVLVSVGISAAFTPAIAALAFTIEYGLGGTGVASIRTVATAMVGVHLLIGIGEAVLTVLTVRAVLALRPDLVHAARHVPVAIPHDIAPRGTASPTGVGA